MKINRVELDKLIEEDIQIKLYQRRINVLKQNIRDIKKSLQAGDDTFRVDFNQCDLKILQLNMQIREEKIRKEYIYTKRYKDNDYLKYRATDREKLEYINNVLGTTYQVLDGHVYKQIVTQNKLSLNFIDIFLEEFDILDVIKYQILTECFVNDHLRFFTGYWSALCKHQQFSMEFLKKHYVDVDWKSVAIAQNSFRTEVLGLEPFDDFESNKMYQLGMK